MAAQRPSLDLKLNLPVHILFLPFHEGTAAKIAFFATFLAQLTISPGKLLRADLLKATLHGADPD